MRMNKVRETVLAKYIPSSSPKEKPYKYVPVKTKRLTLEEFYQEVHAKNNLHQEHSYHNKNAQEIESIMMQNRRLIDAKRNPRR